MEYDKTKHLEFIQNVISRLNSNSFQIKGWAITIIAAILALLATTQNPEYILVGIFSLVLFWLMDGYCLTQERRFRGLYNDVAGIAENPKKLKPFEMNPKLYNDSYYSFWRILWTRTIWIIYWSIIFLLSVIYTCFKLN